MKRAPFKVIILFFLLSVTVTMARAYAEETHESNHKEAPASPTSHAPEATPASATTASGVFTNEMKEKMMMWSRQLGVTCVHCHSIDNFKDDKKPSFKTALKHDKMVKVLQEDVFNDRDAGKELKVKVQCFMCHRGLQWPEYIEQPNVLTK